MTTTHGLRRTTLAGATVAALISAGACSGFFDVPNTNQPNLEDLTTNPTRAKLSGAATGLFAGARGDIQGLIWRVGSLGREGINLSGNNQPDYLEPYFLSTLVGSGFGGALWGGRYAHIRNINTYLTALDKVSTAQVSDAEKAASRGLANTLKALAFVYVIETRDSLGAPVDVDVPITAPLGPFVSRDSVYGYVIGLLDSAQTDLGRAGASFPFTIPSGFGSFNTPSAFLEVNRALAAKAQVLRATAAGCGVPCYTAALAALSSSFLSSRPADFTTGAYFNFSTGSNDVTNGLSDPLGSVNFYAHPSELADAQLQPGGAKDQRVVDKITAATDTQTVGGISEIPGTDKFTVYFTGGQADPGHSIPIIRDEELVLLRAEANWFGGNKLQALADIDSVRIGAGKLTPTTVTIASPDSAFVKELLYNRRYSLMWEQGTRWIDARRYNRMGDVPATPPTGGHVAKVMPIPDNECAARGLLVNCTPLNP